MTIDENNIDEPPDNVLLYLTDAHCHPTDDPRPWNDVDVLCDKLRKARIGRVCAMSTSTRDQRLVAHLANALPHKVIPAFGYHPWFSHMISIESHEGDHYRSVLKTRNTQEDKVEYEELIKNLSPPRSLSDVVEELRENFAKHPNALLGEVGIDRVFRLPRDPKGWSREPTADDDEETNDDDAGHSLGLRRRPLTNVVPSIDHQRIVAKAQIVVAIEHRRSVSFHSVRAGGALMMMLDELEKEYPSGAEKGRKARKAREQLFIDPQDKVGALCFQDINLDLHSCTLSPEMIRQIQQKYPNVFVSFSLAINARQRDLIEQLRACDPSRLLIESDWHSAEGLGARCWSMIRAAADTIGPPLLPSSEEGEKGESYRHAARFLHANWLRFMRQADE